MLNALLAAWLLAAPDPVALVRDLGAPEYATREQATAALRQLGPAARAALEAVESSPDPEVRERARALLNDLRSGITPEWPADLAELARGYAQLSADERLAFIQRLAKELELRSVPFLQARLAKGSPAEQAEARRFLAEFANTTVQAMRTALRRNDPARVQQLAQQCQSLADLDARLLYLQAETLPAVEAAPMRRRALALGAEDEASHYRCAELLGELRRDALARAEWQRILEIPPADDVYDINAYLRLSDLEARAARYGAAADYLEKALVAYQNARRGGRGGYGMVGGSEKDLEAKIRTWRRLAKNEASPPLVITATVKDNAGAELQRALQTVASSLTINVEPRELRLFDQNAAALAYDPNKQELSVTLNNRPCGPVVKLKLGEPGRIAVFSGDCCYIYAVDPQTGRATKQARFEFDYTVRLKPDGLPKNWTDLSLQINDKPCTLEAAQQGIAFDALPPKFSLQIRGTDPDGQPQTIQLTGSTDDLDLSRE